MPHDMTRYLKRRISLQFQSDSGLRNLRNWKSQTLDMERLMPYELVEQEVEFFDEGGGLRA